MMNPIIYILSQIFIIISYAFLFITFQDKERKKVLINNLFSQIAMASSYLLLGAYSGAVTSGVSITRNIIFLCSKDINNNKKITKKEMIILFILLNLSLITGIITYDGIFSLLPVIATMLYTYAIIQKDLLIYKYLEFPIGIMYIIYNIYVSSIFGILLELSLMISSAIGIIRSKKKN